MTKNKLLKSGFIFTIGNVLLQGLAFITLPIYTRIISKEVFGQFNLYISWISIISLIIGLQLSGSLGVAKIKYKEKYDEYTVNILTISNIFFFIVFIVSYFIREYLSLIFSFSENYVVLMILQSYLGYLSGFLSGYFIQLQKTTIAFFLSLFGAITNVVLSISLVYYLDDDFLARVVGNITPAIIVSLITFIYFYKKKNIIYKKEYLFWGLSISLPLIFHQLGHNILNQFDRIMIGKMMTFKEVAVYSFGYNIGLVIQIVLHSINTAWIPWFFDAKKNNNEELHYYISRYIAIGVFLTLGYLTIFPELAYIMGGEQYRDSITFISLIIISYFFVFLYTFPVNIQFYNENTKFIPFGTLFAGVLNIVLNFLMIPKLDIYGAALATIISYLVLLVIHHLLTKKLYNYKEVTAKKYFFLIVIVISYSLLMNYFIDSLVIRWSLGIVVLIFYVVYYKKDLIKLIKDFKGI